MDLDENNEIKLYFLEVRAFLVKKKWDEVIMAMYETLTRQANAQWEWMAKGQNTKSDHL